jgi:HEAT repeat protein
MFARSPIFRSAAVVAMALILLSFKYCVVAEEGPILNEKATAEILNRDDLVPALLEWIRWQNDRQSQSRKARPSLPAEIVAIRASKERSLPALTKIVLAANEKTRRAASLVWTSMLRDSDYEQNAAIRDAWSFLPAEIRRDYYLWLLRYDTEIHYSGYKAVPPPSPPPSQIDLAEMGPCVIQFVTRAIESEKTDPAYAHRLADVLAQIVGGNTGLALPAIELVEQRFPSEPMKRRFCVFSSRPVRGQPRPPFGSYVDFGFEQGFVEKAGRNAIPLLLPRLASPNSYARNYAIEALGQIEGYYPEDVLKKLLQLDDCAPKVYRWAQNRGAYGLVPSLIARWDLFTNQYNYDRNAMDAAIFTLAEPKHSGLLLRELKAKRWVFSDLLACFGEQETEAYLLSEIKKKENRWDARLIVEDLGVLRCRQAIPMLVPWLKDESKEIRDCAAKALAKIGTRDALEAIFKNLPDPTTRPWMQGLAKYCSVSDLDILLPQTTSHNRALETLATLEDRAAIPRLIELVGNENVDVRFGAVCALSRFRAKESEAALIAALSDDYEPTVRTAAQTLGLMRSKRALTALVDAVGAEFKYKPEQGDSAWANYRFLDARSLLVDSLLCCTDLSDAKQALRDRLTHVTSVDGKVRVALALCDLGHKEGLATIAEAITTTNGPNSFFILCQSMSKIADEAAIADAITINPRSREWLRDSAVLPKALLENARHDLKVRVNVFWAIETLRRLKMPAAISELISFAAADQISRSAVESVHAIHAARFIERDKARAAMVDTVIGGHGFIVAQNIDPPLSSEQSSRLMQAARSGNILAIIALGKGAAIEAEAMLVDLAGHSDLSTRYAALQALGDLGPRQEKTFEILEEIARNSSGALSWVASYALANSGVGSADRLLRRLSPPGEQCQFVDDVLLWLERAIRLHGNQRVMDQRYLNALLPISSLDSSPFRRIAALSCLSALGGKLELAALKRALESDTDELVQAEVAAKLLIFNPTDSHCMNVLRKSIREGHADLQVRACELAVEIGRTELEPEILALARATKDPGQSWRSSSRQCLRDRVFIAAVSAIEMLRKQRERPTDELTERLISGESAERAVAALALGRKGDVEALPFLRLSINADDRRLDALIQYAEAKIEGHARPRELHLICQLETARYKLLEELFADEIRHCGLTVEEWFAVKDTGY